MATNALILLCTLLWGLGTPLIKLVSGPPIMAATIRLSIAAPVLVVMGRLGAQRFSLRTLRGTFVPGVLYGLNNVLVFMALDHASVTIVSVLLALQPAFIVVAAGPLLGEWPSRRHLVLVVIGVAGGALVALGGQGDAHADIVGVLLALGGTLAFVVYYVMSRQSRLAGDVTAVEWMAGVTMSASVVLLPVAVVSSSPGDLGRFGLGDWLLLSFIAIGAGVAAHTTLAWLQRFVPAGRSSLALVGMNVVSLIVAWPLNGERASPVQALGAAIALTAVALAVAAPSVVSTGRAVERGLERGSARRVDARP